MDAQTVTNTHALAHGQTERETARDRETNRETKIEKTNRQRQTDRIGYLNIEM